MRATRDRRCELLQVEGVAAAFPVEVIPEHRVDGAAEQLAGLGGREGRELDALSAAPSLCLLERGDEARGAHARPRREKHQDRPFERTVEDVADQVDRGGIGPVKVIERDHERPAPADVLEQRTYGAKRELALVPTTLPPPGSEPPQRRKGGHELALGPRPGIEVGRLETGEPWL